MLKPVTDRTGIFVPSHCGCFENFGHCVVVLSCGHAVVGYKVGLHPILNEILRNFKWFKEGIEERKLFLKTNHRLPKLKSRLFDVFFRALRAADSTYVVYATA